MGPSGSGLIPQPGFSSLRLGLMFLFAIGAAVGIAITMAHAFQSPVIPKLPVGPLLH